MEPAGELWPFCESKHYTLIQAVPKRNRSDLESCAGTSGAGRAAGLLAKKRCSDIDPQALLDLHKLLVDTQQLNLLKCMDPAF